LIRLTENQLNNKRRPDLLTVLCVLTFIGSGISALANGLVYLTLDSLIAAYEEGAFDIFEGKLQLEAIETLLNVRSSYYLLQALFFSVSFYGALMMWKLRKIGFHLYTIAQIVLLILGKVFIPSLPFPLVPLLIMVTFVILYARNLQFMR
jgi:hypothetical protein